MATIYVRAVPDELDAWLDERARYLAMSKAAFVRLVLASAKAENWPERRFANKKGNGNAAVHPTPTPQPLRALSRA